MPARSRSANGYFKVRRGWSTGVHTLDLSSDGARVAVIRLWDQGKAVAGSFASEAQLREVMGRYSRFLPELRAKGWLDGLDIHDWDEDQANPDPGAADRMRRARAKLRDRSAPVTPSVTPPVTPALPPLTETETETELTTPSGVLAKSGSEPIARVYGAWLEAWHFTVQQRRLTTPRRSVIRARWRDFPVEVLVAAVRGSAMDPWPERVNQNDLPQLLKPTNIERFRDWFVAGHGPQAVSETDRRVAGMLMGAKP